jgi:DNA repair protein SbcC/Rad50
MIPIRLELRNFLPYRSPDPIRFEGIHLACLTGPNGAGKSSMLDAITWALWGRARAKRDEDLILLGQEDMYVQMDFEQEGVVYRVIRRRSRKHRGQGALDLFVLDGERPRTITEPSMKATQDKIDALLRLDYETFVNSAFLQQGRADAFTTKPPAQRKQILSDILGLSRWETYEEAAKERLKAIDGELNVIDVRIKEIDGELLKETGLRLALAEAETAFDEAQMMLVTAEKHLEEVAFAPNEMRMCQERKAEIQRHIQERERDQQEILAEIEEKQAGVDRYEAVIANRVEIEDGYAALQTARQMDTALGDKLRSLKSFDDENFELQTRLAEIRAELQAEARQYETSIHELARILENARPDDLAEVQTEVAELQALDAERAQFQDVVVSLGEERARLDGTNRALRIEMNNLKDRLDRLSAADSAVCPLCGQPLDEQHRGELIEQLTAEGKTRGDTFRANEIRLKDIVAEVAEYKQAVHQRELELKRLTPLIERAGLLQAQIDAANEASTRLDEAQAKLDAVRDVLDNESFGMELRQRINELEAQRDEIGYDAETHDNARKQLDDYLAFEARQTELQVALNALPNAKGALEIVLARQARIETALNEDRASLEAVEKELARLVVLVGEFNNRQAEVNRLRTSAGNAYERLVNARQELDALGKQRLRKAELETRRDGKRHEQAIYDELKKAFGKNGIPAMIIETAIPELESAANRLLTRMTDGRMSLMLNTQREKITGGVAETLDIQIADELGTRSYEMYSGGEAFRINFALRVALSQMLARRAGAHLRTLFIDEGFGTQDDDGRNKLVEAITAVQEDFDMILIITHIDELRDSFPVHIVVEKTPSGSRVSVR